MSGTADLDREWSKGHASGKKTMLETVMDQMRLVLRDTPQSCRETVRLAFVDLERRLGVPHGQGI